MCGPRSGNIASHKSLMGAVSDRDNWLPILPNCESARKRLAAASLPQYDFLCKAGNSW